MAFADGATRQLTVLDPATWQVLHTVDLSRAGDLVQLDAATPTHATVSYTGADDWAVVDLASGAVAAHGDGAGEYSRERVRVSAAGPVLLRRRRLGNWAVRRLANRLRTAAPK